MIEFIKKLVKIVKEYDSDKQQINNKVDHATNFIKERTVIHSDVHLKSESQVIMIGRYKNRDFVNIYDIGEGDFEALLDHVKELNRYAKKGRFDGPWPLVHQVIDKELHP